MPNQELKLLDHSYGIVRLSPESAIPAWADGDGFVSISRTDDELSIACRQSRIPADADVRQDRDWACLKLIGPFAFGETGIVLSVIRPISEIGIGIFVVSTFDGDHLLIKSADLGRATEAWRAAGHDVS